MEEAAGGCSSSGGVAAACTYGQPPASAAPPAAHCRRSCRGGRHTPRLSLLLLLLAALFGYAAAQSDINTDFALQLPLLFYEMQQSGALPAWNKFLVTGGGIGWRGDAHLRDGSGPDGLGVDLSGGWYASGDHMKYTQPTAYAVSTMVLGAVLYEEEFRMSGVFDDVMLNVLWGAEWLAKAHVNASDVGEDNVLVAQVGDVDTEAEYWGRPEQQPEGGAEGEPGWRPVYTVSIERPGSDVAGAASAALLASSTLLRLPGPFQDASLADAYETRGRQLYLLGEQMGQPWAGPPGGGAPYPYAKATFEDDMAAASAWLCRIDASVAFESCELARAWWSAADASLASQPVAGWSNQLPFATVTLALSDISDTPAEAAQRDAYLRTYVGMWEAAAGVPCAAGVVDPEVLCATDDALVYTGPGGAPDTAVASLVAMMASEARVLGASVDASVDVRRSRQCLAVGQLRYLLGENALGVAYLMGYQGIGPEPAR
mmetsp:Transcript_31894/g.95252  ORF Transcript_31894/g.95252 Transcript_31894/m.95252 type:complete len:487 (-) Transcript_31894:368-1828(-)